MIRLVYFIVLLSFILGSNFSMSSIAKPNLLLITVDDMSADSVGVFGSNVPQITPNIDGLARNGLRFERAHVQVANCMPSRNVMWSGRYPQSNKVEGFFPVQEPGYPTLVDLAKKAGYFTAIRHKLKDSTPYHPYGWDMVLDVAPGTVRPSAKDAKSYGLSTAQGIRSAKQAGKPFCLLINVADPHVPFFGLNRKGEEVKDVFVPSRIYRAEDVSVPGFLNDDPVVRMELAHYFSSVRRADDAVGQILYALEESGEADNTLVMLLSDNGMPFPFAKTQLYHHSTRTPMIFRWPGVTHKDSIDAEHLVSAVDILPTLLDAIGEEIPAGIEGRSFLPLLKGEPQQGREVVFKVHSENAAGHRTPMRAVEGPRFLYIFNPWSNGSRMMHSATNETRTYKRMVELASSDKDVADRLNLLKFRVPEEFYDIQSDPDCLVNLVADPKYQQELEKYQGLLERWLREVQDPMLAAFLGRHDPQVVEAYMREQIHISQQRNEWNQAIRKKLLNTAPSSSTGS